MKKSLLLLFVLFTTLTLTNCVNEPLGDSQPPVVIEKNSDLYNLLIKVTNGGNNILDEDIVCLDFIYPFTLIIYDSNYTYIGIQTLISDESFSAFLGNLPDGHSISISYPIQTTLADGTVFSVTNNEELKLVLDSCSREDIISYCNSTFTGSQAQRCYWKVKYDESNSNKYVGGVFSAGDNNTLTFTYNDQTFQGTWIFLFVNDKLHMNIHLLGNSLVAQDWNIDRELTLDINQFIISNTPKNIVLEKYCETATDYTIGQSGPAGGIIFYDKGEYSNGWRYMEVAPQDLGIFEWGCLNSSITTAQSSAIGKGLYNTGQIVNYHDNLNNFYGNPSVCNALNNGTVASKETFQFNVNDFDDWFLPSSEELLLVYNNLNPLGLGNLTFNYWSATEVNNSTVKTLNVTNGNLQNSSKTAVEIQTRVIRYF